MTDVASRPATRRFRPGGKSGVARDLAGALPLAAGMAGATWWLASLPASYLLVAGLLYGAMAVWIFVRVPDDAPGPGLGAANRVTLVRATLAVPVGALCLPPVALGTIGLWWVIGLGTAVMVLDGVDGRIARQTGTETAFGARFDMELDAALILALSVLVWADGTVGPWCLSIGLMRYLFVAASWLWPALGAELPERSYRRKAVCVVQGVVLLVALGPVIPDAVAVAVVGAGVASLSYSFAVDVHWALSNAG